METNALGGADIMGTHHKQQIYMDGKLRSNIVIATSLDEMLFMCCWNGH